MFQDNFTRIPHIIISHISQAINRRDSNNYKQRHWISQQPILAQQINLKVHDLYKWYIRNHLLLSEILIESKNIKKANA